MKRMIMRVDKEMIRPRNLAIVIKNNSGICLEGLGKTTKLHSQDTGHPSNGFVANIHQQLQEDFLIF
jgi:hypothetical protein